LGHIKIMPPHIIEKNTIYQKFKFGKLDKIENILFIPIFSFLRKIKLLLHHNLLEKIILKLNFSIN
jgi:hypothetical protein